MFYFRQEPIYIHTSKKKMAARMFFEKITQNVFPPYSNCFVCLLSIHLTFITIT